ncbi:malate dehydrogenase [Xylocopa sonorina]|uniref:malate dehydrogenase n=1 Tax=Xylocopa sonorina TaxID=1818115 RepID=UPI00403B003D
MNLERYKSAFNSYSRRKNVLKVAVTDGTTEIARSFVYRIFTDNVFGENQSVFVSLYELPEKATFMESVMIELTSFSPNLLNGISYSNNASVEFKNADVVICIGVAREYDFKSEEYNDLFFEEHVRVSKFYGEAIEKYAKRDAKIIVLGNTTATIISKYATSIPKKNITTLSLINLNIAAAQIAARAQCLATEVKNIIIWGSNGSYSFPDCRYAYLASGKTLSDSVKVWIRNVLPRNIQNVFNRPAHIRSIAYALAEHCKILWNGTPEKEWTSMGVMSDQSYNVRAGIFFSYPVYCRNGQYEIVQDLDHDRYIKKYILDLNILIYREIDVALKICDLIPYSDP